MKRRFAFLGLAVLVVAVGAGITIWRQGQDTIAEAAIRDTLFAAVQPVGLRNCTLRRYGESGDGGYLLCANRLDAIEAAYSYGINGYDQWGCDVSAATSVPVHRYDCFNTANPVCLTGKAVFHAECIGTNPATIDGRPFDSFENQLQKNGDAGKRLVVKIDVEGAEWDALLQTPIEVLGRIDQLVVEFHIPPGPRFAFFLEGRPVIEERFVAAIKRLREHFHVANLHFNNYGCVRGFEPLPGRVFEILFVSKRLDEVDPSVRATVPHRLDEPNGANRPDCQVVPSR